MDETTTVNIKSIRVDVWERAKRAAEANDETMGSWVSRACDQLVAIEANGQRLFPPANPVNPPPDPRAEDDLVRCRAWAEVLVTMHNAGKDPPQWLTGAIFRKAGAALGVAPPPQPKRPLALGSDVQ